MQPHCHKLLPQHCRQLLRLPCRSRIYQLYKR
nr:MAG TPA: hypothetical protein [Caudoviricetes sp.]